MSKRPAILAVGLMLLLLGGYLAIAARTTLFDRDEARFAQAAVEMVASGNMLYPTFGGALRADKPILIYWLMAGSIRVLGPTELAVRLPGCVTWALSCLITFYLGRRLFSPRAGLIAMGVMGSSLLAVYLAPAAVADGPLLLGIVLAVWAIVAMRQGGVTTWKTLGLGGALGVALLAKGPVGLAIPLLMAGGAWAVSRWGDGNATTMPPAETPARIGGEPWHFILALSLAALLGLAIFVTWAWPANVATQGDYLRVGLGRHVVQRMVSPMDTHGGSTLGTYLLTLPLPIVFILVFFMPWTLYLPAALHATITGRMGHEARAVLLGWFLPTLILMSLIVTKLPNYMLGAWPALTLMVGGCLDRGVRGNPSPAMRRWLAVGRWMYLAQAGGLGLAMIGLAWWMPTPGGRMALALAGGISLGIAAWVHHHRRPEQQSRQAWGVGLGTVVWLIVVSVGLLPTVERTKLSPALAATLQQAHMQGVPVAAVDYVEPSLLFYLAPSQVTFLTSEAQVERWLEMPAGQPGVLLLSPAQLKAVRSEGLPAGVREVGRVTGVNLASSHAPQVVILARE